MKTMLKAINGMALRYLYVLLCLLGMNLSAFAGGLLNAGVYISPTTLSTGQTVGLKNAIKATGTLPNITVTFQIRRVSSDGVINPYAIYSKTLTGQYFAANETKGYQNTYTIPANMVSGVYTYTIKATNAAKTVTYLNLQSKVAPYIFNVNGRADSGYVRGINIMDMASGAQNLPGIYNKDYTKPSLVALQKLKGRGLEVVRITFKWERLQPTLGGPLNTAYLGYLMQILKDANSAGIKVILDMHNFGRYTPTTTTERIAYAFGDPNGPTQAQFADVWSKLSTAVRADTQAYSAVYAYDIMNEPYGLVAVGGLTPPKVWEAYSQAAVSGIRSVNDSTLIQVEGYSYASASNWPSNHPTKWITDPLNKTMYHAHMYLDNDTSGKYVKTHAEELALAQSQGFATVGERAVARVKKFADWLADQNAVGFIGEVGWPNSAVVGTTDATEWNKDGEDVFNYMDTVNLGGTMWATGSWISATGNILNVYELDYGTTRTFNPLSQAVVLERHPGNKK